MKSYKFFTGLLFFLLVVSAISTQAYTPQDEGFVEAVIYATPENPSNVLVGDTANMTIVVKNLTNNTINNITINQNLRLNTEILSIDGQEVGEHNFTDLTVTDTLYDQQLTFSYFNISENNRGTNITANLPLELVANDALSFSFELNFTIAGVFIFEAPTVSYFDHWGDEKTDIQAQGTEVEVSEISEDSRTQYIPSFETEEPNYTVIVGGFIAVLVIALLGRVLHLKLPVEL